MTDRQTLRKKPLLKKPINCVSCCCSNVATRAEKISVMVNSFVSRAAQTDNVSCTDVQTKWNGQDQETKQAIPAAAHPGQIRATAAAAAAIRLHNASVIGRSETERPTSFAGRHLPDPRTSRPVESCPVGASPRLKIDELNGRADRDRVMTPPGPVPSAFELEQLGQRGRSCLFLHGPDAGRAIPTKVCRRLERCRRPRRDLDSSSLHCESSGDAGRRDVPLPTADRRPIDRQAEQRTELDKPVGCTMDYVTGGSRLGLPARPAPLRHPQ
jgi:hypothetical protein